jgi:two-component system cell cycle sensor histidine kinase/response regulator CckA
LKDENKAKEQLLKELRKRTAELEKSETLRKRAEEALRLQTGDLKEPSTEDVQSLIHELKMHQIELEMQNEELRRAQIELEESRNKYSDLYDFAPIGYFTFDKNGLILDVNLRGAKKLGVERSFLIKKPLFLYIAPDSKNTFYLHLKQVFSTKIRQTCELKLVGKGGIQFYAQLESLLVQDGRGKFSQCRTAIIDITERKWAEKALQESEKKYRGLYDSLKDGVFLVDMVGYILECNQAYLDMLGYTKEEIRLLTYQQLTPEKWHEMEAAIVTQRIAERGYSDEYEKEYIKKDGTVFPTSLRVWLIKNEQGEPMGMWGIVRDITERKQIEEKLLKSHNELEIHVQERTTELVEANKALLESEDRYRELAESIDEVFYALDRDLRYIYWNNASEALTGISAKDAVGKSLFELFPELKGSRAEKLYKEVLKTQQPQHFVNKYRSKDKNLVFEINAYSSKFGLSVIAKDITEKKKLEEQALRAQRMQSIGTLAGGIAHDLNNMLTPIMLSLQMLKEKFKDEQSQRLLTILELNSQREANLIKQILSFARGVEGERKPLQVTNIISEIEKVIKETFPKSIEIRTDIQKDLSAISGDSTQLHQVLMNLCVNARDAMQDGGILSISAENIFVDENYARMYAEAKVGSYVVITVSDTGTGIPPEIMDRIFEPFFTTKEHGKGTGLGLSTSLGIVKSHGGFITVYSEVGQGTKFSIHLPVITTIEEQKAEGELGLPVGQGELVLVVDDEATIREITCSTLEAYGYRVITANDGAEAAALYAQNIEETRVVLMDMAMPNMDGLASIRVLRKINPKVKIIAASGLTEREKLTKVENINANAFLPKPYTAEKLLKTIHEVLCAK